MYVLRLVSPFGRCASLCCSADGPATTLSCAVPAAIKPCVTFLVTRVTHALRPCSGFRRMRLTLPSLDAGGPEVCRNASLPAPLAVQPAHRVRSFERIALTQSAFRILGSNPSQSAATSCRNCARITHDRTRHTLETRPVEDRPSWRVSAEPASGVCSDSDKSARYGGSPCAVPSCLNAGT
jgi:hypothetical protein